jgi:hypothetical protein
MSDFNPEVLQQKQDLLYNYSYFKIIDWFFLMRYCHMKRFE